MDEGVDSEGEVGEGEVAAVDPADASGGRGREGLEGVGETRGEGEGPVAGDGLREEGKAGGP